MTKKVKWGIWGTGTGSIGSRLADCFPHVGNGEVHACLSRSQENADEFARQYSVTKAYSNTQAFLADPEIDVVYVGTPNFAHLENVLECIKAGKNVLCEKPMAMNVEELRIMQQAADQKGVFLMEAMWTRFFPAYQKMREWIDAGRIGKTKMMQSAFCVKAVEGGWRLDGNRQGGALYDLGVYCLTYVDAVFGLEPLEIKSEAYIKNGTDIANSVTLKYADDKFTTFMCGLETVSEHSVMVQGDKGCIRVTDKFWCPRKLELFGYDGAGIWDAVAEEVFEDPYPVHGFQYEAEHVGECILSGKKESEIMTAGVSLQIAQLVDRIRKDWEI